MDKDQMERIERTADKLEIQEVIYNLLGVLIDVMKRS